MATRGWQDVKPSDIANLGRGRANVPAVKSKYRNVKVTVDGLQFDSKRESAEYLHLKARQAAGEIRNLECQVPFILYAPDLLAPGSNVAIANYIADFTFEEQTVESGTNAVSWPTIIVDVKGGKVTKEFALKRKWLYLQQGIVIREIR